MTHANKLISFFTGILVAFLAGAAFRLSFDALRNLAAANGIAIGMAWLYPAIIDGAIIIFSLSVLQASLNQSRTHYPWALVAVFTLLSIALNIVHAQRAFLPRVLAAIPPVALFLSFELLMGQVKGMVERAAVWQSLQQLETAVRQKQAELDTAVQERTTAIEKLNAHLDRLTAKKAELADELKALRSGIRTEKVSGTGSIERARAVRAEAKQEAMTALLAYLADNPDASLSDMAAVIGRSRSTAGSYVSELTASGKLYKNGHGWEVMNGER